MRNNIPVRIFYTMAAVAAVAVGWLIVDRYSVSVEARPGDTVITTSPAPSTTTTIDLAPAYEYAAQLQRVEGWEFVRVWHDAEVAAFLSAWKDAETRAANERAASRVPARQPAMSTAVVKSRGRTGSPNGSFMACVKNRESRGNYRAVNPSSSAGGAWQFLPGTWNNTARHAGRPDLVGVAPQDASPADQDAMAAHLYAWQGGSPWAGPGC